LRPSSIQRATSGPPSDVTWCSSGDRTRRRRTHAANPMPNTTRTSRAASTPSRPAVGSNVMSVLESVAEGRHAALDLTCVGLRRRLKGERPIDPKLFDHPSVAGALPERIPRPLLRRRQAEAWRTRRTPRIRGSRASRPLIPRVAREASGGDAGTDSTVGVVTTASTPITGASCSTSPAAGTPATGPSSSSAGASATGPPSGPAGASATSPRRHEIYWQGPAHSRRYHQESSYPARCHPHSWPPRRVIRDPSGQATRVPNVARAEKACGGLGESASGTPVDETVSVSGKCLGHTGDPVSRRSLGI
jgi:hypothetical protein